MQATSRQGCLRRTRLTKTTRSTPVRARSTASRKTRRTLLNSAIVRRARGRRSGAASLAACVAARTKATWTSPSIRLASAGRPSEGTTQKGLVRKSARGHFFFRWPCIHDRESERALRSDHSWAEPEHRQFCSKAFGLVWLALQIGIGVSAERGLDRHLDPRKGAGIAFMRPASVLVIAPRRASRRSDPTNLCRVWIANLRSVSDVKPLPDTGSGALKAPRSRWKPLAGEWTPKSPIMESDWLSRYNAAARSWPL